MKIKTLIKELQKFDPESEFDITFVENYITELPTNYVPTGTDFVFTEFLTYNIYVKVCL